MKKRYLIILLVMSLLSACSKENNSVFEYDVDKYVSINVSGINGYGVLDYTVNIDDDSIYKIKCNPDKDSLLSNGDKVSVYCDIYTKMDDSSYIIDTNEIIYEVKGLEDCNLISLSDLYDFSFIGDNGSACLSYKPKDINNMANDIKLNVSATRINENNEIIDVDVNSIENGDTVEIYAETKIDHLEFLNKYDCLPDTAVLSLIADVKTIATTYDEIDPKFIEKATKSIEKYYEDNKGSKSYEYYKYELCDQYFGYDVSYDGKQSNCLYLIYFLDYHIVMGDASSYYQYFKFDNVEANDDSIDENELFEQLDCSNMFGNVSIENIRTFIVSDRWDVEYKTW